jgi:hypothetical protein
MIREPAENATLTDEVAMGALIEIAKSAKTPN